MEPMESYIMSYPETDSYQRVREKQTELNQCPTMQQE